MRGWAGENEGGMGNYHQIRMESVGTTSRVGRWGGMGGNERKKGEEW